MKALIQGLKIIAALSILIMAVSCEKYEDEILPMVGVYEANVVGVGGPYSVSISIDFGDRLTIDAPWDGEIWDAIDAEVRNQYDYKKEIIIYEQELEPGVFIWGEGVFYDYTIQLDYTIEVDNIKYGYTLVGTKM